MKNSNNSILVVGKPNSGKSGFFGQLYTRLELEQEGNYARLLKTPDNITALGQITSRYAEGKALEHTPVGDYEKIELFIDIGGHQISLLYPDYGGEQINYLIENRRLNDEWYSAIQKSNEWFLFIRLSDLNKTYDPIQRFTEIVEAGEQKDKASLEKNKVPSDQAFYIELMQMLLFYKGIGFTKRVEIPKLIVTLSCWDEYENTENAKPADLLKEHLPLFYQFLNQNWDASSLKIIGLSSQGKALDKTNSDEDYIHEDEGFLVETDGSVTNDLTSILKIILS